MYILHSPCVWGAILVILVQEIPISLMDSHHISLASGPARPVPRNAMRHQHRASSDLDGVQYYCTQHARYHSHCFYTCIHKISSTAHCPKSTLRHHCIIVSSPPRKTPVPRASSTCTSQPLPRALRSHNLLTTALQNSPLPPFPVVAASGSLFSLLTTTYGGGILDYCCCLGTSL